MGRFNVPHVVQILTDSATVENYPGWNYEANNTDDTQDSPRHKKEHEGNKHTFFSKQTHDPSVYRVRRFEKIKYSFVANDELQYGVSLGLGYDLLTPCTVSLAYLGASINLMPLSVWEGLSLPRLTPTCMTLELADRSISKPIGIAKDVSVKVGVFHFPADFVVVDFKPDPRVPLILRRCFLNSGRALIDVYKGLSLPRLTPTCMTLELADRSISKPIGIAKDVSVKVGVFHFPADFVVVDFEPDPRVPLILRRCFLNSGRALIDVDFLLFEEADAFLGLENDPNSPEFNPFYYDPEGDILFLEAILNSKPLAPFPNHEQYMPSFKKELKVYEAKTVKSSVDEPPEVELKDLPPHLEYAFLEGNNKLPIIIAKELGDEEKSALIKGGFTIVKNEENELIPTRLVTRWRPRWGNDPEKLFTAPDSLRETSTQYNLALFILKRMERTQNKPKELLPYGMLLTRLFNHVASNFPELAIDRYILYDRVMHLLTRHYEGKTQSDHGTKRCFDLNPSSSSTALNHSSSSHQLDENDEESSHSSTPSLPQLINSLSNVVPRVVENLLHESQSLNSYQTEIINHQIQHRYEHQKGLRSIEKALKNMMKKNKK
nr:hypothetical protein [Tanacetum cinerariifolium]